MGSLIFLGVLAAIAVWGVGMYNRLVRLRNGSEGAWSDVDVQLKRRWDLIPNLVETVKGYAQHESQTFEEVTKARARAMDAGDAASKSEAEGALSRVLGNLFAVAEAYPELRANENFLSLQGELTKIEEAIQNARRYYNAIVRDLNTACEEFPSNVVAGVTGFVKKDYFELDTEAERSAPQVSFS
ncbi:MAG: LemA family protein [Myxococcota bacterium]|nr:LemA family protein [Myxococcota bacterium]